MIGKDLILKSRAALYLNTSVVVMTQSEYEQYLTNLIDFNYPNLKYNDNELYRFLTFQDRNIPDNIDLYEWWLSVPIGPQSCSRDIGDVRELFGSGKGDEWELDLENLIIEYQKNLSAYLRPTGYVCAETIKRKRMTI